MPASQGLRPIPTASAGTGSLDVSFPPHDLRFLDGKLHFSRAAKCLCQRLLATFKSFFGEDEIRAPTNSNTLSELSPSETLAGELPPGGPAASVGAHGIGGEGRHGLAPQGGASSPWAGWHCGHIAQR